MLFFGCRERLAQGRGVAVFQSFTKPGLLPEKILRRAGRGGRQGGALPPVSRPDVGALLPLRKRYELFCSLRPARFYEGLEGLSPLRRDIAEQG